MYWTTGSGFYNLSTGATTSFPIVINDATFGSYMIGVNFFAGPSGATFWPAGSDCRLNCGSFVNVTRPNGSTTVSASAIKGAVIVLDKAENQLQVVSWFDYSPTVPL